jgi:exoribonuclease II
MTDSAIQEYVAEMTRHALKSVQVIPADQRQNFTRQLSTIICYAFDEQNRKVPLVIMSQLVHAPLKGFLSRTIYFMTIDEARKKDEAGQLYVEVIAKFTADALALRPVAPTPTPTPTLILVK